MRTDKVKAPEILKQAAKHIEDRAAARDQPEGERSMGKTVAAFNAITGNNLSERDGWVFMQALKLARACNTASGLADDYEDAAAYAALAGEAASYKPEFMNFSRELPDRRSVVAPLPGEVMMVRNSGPYSQKNPCPDPNCVTCNAR